MKHKNKKSSRNLCMSRVAAAFLLALFIFSTLSSPLFSVKTQASTMPQNGAGIMTARADSGYSGSITEVTYELKNPGSGFAGGELTIGLKEESKVAGFYLAWGADGKVLSNTTDLAKFLANVDAATGKVVYSIPDYYLIPEDATELHFYEFTLMGGIASEKNEMRAKKPFILPLNDAAKYVDFGAPLLEIQFASDMHVQETITDGRAHTGLMLTDIAEISPDSMGLFVAGDMVHWNSKENYEAVAGLFAGNAPELKYYSSIGNHECRFDIDSRNEDSYPAMIKQFRKYCTNDPAIEKKSDEPFYDLWVGAYHFIFLGSEHATLNAFLGDYQLSWLTKVLEEGADRAAATFILLHQGFADTIAGTLGNEHWEGIVAGSEAERAFLKKNGKLMFRGSEYAFEKKLLDIMKPYENLFFLSGHSHADLLDDFSYQAADDTYPHLISTAAVVHTASWFYGKESGESYAMNNVSEFYYAYVYRDKVVFRARDVEEKKWASSGYFALPIADNGLAPEKKIVPAGHEPSGDDPKGDDPSENGNAILDFLFHKNVFSVVPMFVPILAGILVVVVLIIVIAKKRKKRKSEEKEPQNNAGSEEKK